MKNKKTHKRKSESCLREDWVAGNLPSENSSFGLSLSLYYCDLCISHLIINFDQLSEDGKEKYMLCLPTSLS